MYESEAERSELLRELIAEQAGETRVSPVRRNFSPNLTARLERLKRLEPRIKPPIPETNPVLPKPEQEKRCQPAKPQRRMPRIKIKLPPRIPSPLDLAIARALQRPPRGSQVPEAESKLRATAVAVKGRYTPEANEAFQRALSAYREDGAGEEHF